VGNQTDPEWIIELSGEVPEIDDINRQQPKENQRLSPLSGVSPENALDGIRLVKNIGDAVGATAYLLKPEIARTLIHESSDIYEPVDHFLEHPKKHDLEFLAVRPYPVDITRAKSTIDDRDERAPVQGLRKRLRSVARALDRVFSKRPWFPR
jgi:glycosyl transferase family 25